MEITPELIEKTVKEVFDEYKNSLKKRRITPDPSYRLYRGILISLSEGKGETFVRLGIKALFKLAEKTGQEVEDIESWVKDKIGKCLVEIAKEELGIKPQPPERFAPPPSATLALPEKSTLTSEEKETIKTTLNRYLLSLKNTRREENLLTNIMEDRWEKDDDIKNFMNELSKEIPSYNLVKDQVIDVLKERASELLYGKKPGAPPKETGEKPGEGARPRPEPITTEAVKTKWCECGEWAYYPNQYATIYKWTDPKTGIEYYHLLCPKGHDVIISVPEYEKRKRLKPKWEKPSISQIEIGEIRKSVEKSLPLRIWSWDFSHIIPLLAIPVVGAIVAAITGSMLFLFASIFGALYAIIPSPEETYKRRLEAIKKAIEKAEVPAKLEKLKALIELEYVKREKEATHYHALAWPKLLLKFSALFCLSLAFIFSNIPLAPLIGLIVALILYFALG